jgi:hypothetical protein
LFQKAALSTPANPGHNELDEQKTGDDGQNNEQIKIFFRHCPCLSVKETEQCQCRYEMEGKIAGIGDRFPEESWDGKRQNALVLRGEIWQRAN